MSFNALLLSQEFQTKPARTHTKKYFWKNFKQNSLFENMIWPQLNHSHSEFWDYARLRVNDAINSNCSLFSWWVTTCLNCLLSILWNISNHLNVLLSFYVDPSKIQKHENKLSLVDHSHWADFFIKSRDKNLYSLYCCLLQ